MDDDFKINADTGELTNNERLSIKERLFFFYYQIKKKKK